MVGRVARDHALSEPVTVAARRLLAVPAALTAVFVLLPVVVMAASHLRPSTLLATLGDASHLEVVRFSAFLATASSAVTLLVGLPATWALVRHRFVGSSLLRGAISVPFLMPATVVAAGVLGALPDGHNRGLAPILWAHLVFNVAVVVRVVGPRWSMVDHRLERAAASLGAPPWRVLATVVWPEIRTSVASAASLVWVFCFGSFAVVSVLGEFGMRTVETEIFTQATRLGDTDTAVALALVQLVVTGAVLWVGARRSSGGARATAATRARRVRSLPRRRWTAPVVGVAAAVVVAYPLCAVAVRSVRADGRWTFAGYRALFDGTLSTVGLDGGRIVFVSVVFAAVTALVAVPLALVLAAAGRGRTGRAPTGAVRLADLLTSLPVLVSSVTLGLGLLVTFDDSPWAWRDDAWLIPTVHAMLAVPLAVRVIRPALLAVPTSLHRAAATLGASPWRTFVDVDVRTIGPALLRASGVAAAVSLGEFGATSFLSRSGTTTVPIAIGQLLGRPGPLLQQAGFALATLVIVLTAGVMSRA